MEFTLIDGTRLVLSKNEKTQELIAEVFKGDEFLERSYLEAEDLYWKFFLS